MATTKDGMTESDSSSIHSHSYDPATRTLRVKFHKGGTYEYPDFPEEKYAAFSGASSQGQFFARRIGKTYAGRKVRD